MENNRIITLAKMSQQEPVAEEDARQVEDLLMKYYRETLEEETYIQLEIAIATNENIAAFVAKNQVILGGVETFLMKNRVRQAAQRHSKINPNAVPLKKKVTVKKDTTIIIKRKTVIWAIAASLLLLIGFFTLQNQSTSTPALADIYSKYTNEITVLSTLGNDSTALKESIIAYKAEEYNKAAEMYQQFFEKGDKKEHLTYLYYGISLYRQTPPNYELAEKVLDEIIQQRSYISNLSHWHLVLLHLKKGDLNQTKIELNELLRYANAGSDRQKKARELLEELNNIE